jgi:hypothetical protein
MVVTIPVKNIPKYLRNSAFAMAIEDNDDTIDVPESCFKSDLTIRSNTDLTLLLSTLRFWGVDTIPQEVVLYVIWKKPQEILHSTTDYKRELDYLAFLEALCTKTALSCGERASDYWGCNRDISWSSNPSEAAAQVCLIHYDSAEGKIWTADTCALAARLGQVHALKFLHEHGCPWNATTCSSAAGQGNLSCLQYAHENGCRWSATTCTDAAQLGHLSCLKYACDNGCPTEAQTLFWAVGHTRCYTYLFEKGALVPHAKSCAAAARTSNMALLTRLRNEGCPWDESTCEAAAQASSLECLQYAHENGCRWNSKTCDDAARYTSLDCLRYAVEHGCPRSAQLTAYAAQSVVCLKYLHEKGVPWRENVCKQAAFLGLVTSLAYAHEHGCPWDAWTCAAAARWGQLGTLRYAHEHGCLWDAETVNAAAEEGKDGCLKYALEHCCPTDDITTFLAASRSLACLQLTHKHGCAWDAATCAAAAEAGKLDCLQYLHTQGCPWDSATTCSAVKGGGLDCLKYAHEHGCPWVVSELLAIPLTVKSRRCLEYVQEQAPAEAAAFDATPVRKRPRIEWCLAHAPHLLPLLTLLPAGNDALHTEAQEVHGPGLVASAQTVAPAALRIQPHRDRRGVRPFSPTFPRRQASRRRRRG